MKENFNLSTEALKELRKSIKEAKKSYKDTNLKLSPLHKEFCKKENNKGLISFLEQIGFERTMDFKTFQSFLGADFLNYTKGKKKGKKKEHFTFNQILDRIFDIFYAMHETEVLKAARLEREAAAVRRKAEKQKTEEIKESLYQHFLKLEEAKKQVTKIKRRLTAANKQIEQYEADNNKAELKKVNGQVKSLKAELKVQESILKAS